MCRGEHKFKCNNGHCIAASYVCDQEDDCEDNSDELNCREHFADLVKFLSFCVIFPNLLHSHFVSLTFVSCGGHVGVGVGRDRGGITSP